jgi:hypothetical protein
MLMWATVGFVAVEQGVRTGGEGSGSERPVDAGSTEVDADGPGTGPGARARAPGGDPSGISPEERDAVFALHIRFLVNGLVAEAASDPSDD